MKTMQILINPPAYVQSSVASVIQACNGWQTTEVQPLPPDKMIGPDAPHKTLEAQVCGFIRRDPSHDMGTLWFAFDLGIFAALIFVLLIFLIKPHKICLAIWRGLTGTKEAIKT